MVDLLVKKGATVNEGHMVSHYVRLSVHLLVILK